MASMKGMGDVGKALVAVIAFFAAVAGILTWAKVDPPWSSAPSPGEEASPAIGVATTPKLDIAASPESPATASPATAMTAAQQGYGFDAPPEPPAPQTHCTPTFSCDVKLTQVEQLICGNQALCELDHKISSAYTGKLASEFGPAQKAIRREQYYWLKHTRDKCVTESCLMQTHVTRYEELTK